MFCSACHCCLACYWHGEPCAKHTKHCIHLWMGFCWHCDMVYKASRLANVVLCWILDHDFLWCLSRFFYRMARFMQNWPRRWRPYHRHPWPLPSCTLCLLAKYLMSLAELDTHFSLKHLQHMCPDKFHPVSASMGPPKLSKIRNHGIPFWEIRNGSQPSLTGMITAFLCWFARVTVTTPPKRNVSRDMLKLPSNLCISIKNYSTL